MTRLALLAAILLCTFPAHGQNGPPQGPPMSPPAISASMPEADLATGLKSWLDVTAASEGFSGVVLVAHEGRILLNAAYGLADREAGAANTPATAFNVGSIGKAVTHAALMQLAAAGKLKLTDTVGQWLPDYPQAVTRSATIQQLLGHRGGVADFFGPAFRDAPKASFDSNAAYFRFAASQPAVFAPGEGEQYCNGCYAVLGEIIARASGVSYEDYVRANIFKRAGMTTASFVAPAGAAIPYGKPRPDSPLTNVASEHGIGGSAAGGSYATAADLLAFNAALRSGALASDGGAAVLRADPANPEWPRARMGIGGGAPGVNALLAGGQGWTIVVLANLDPPAADRIGRAIDMALLGPPPGRRP